jgi:hypothetical protein
MEDGITVITPDNSARGCPASSFREAISFSPDWRGKDESLITVEFKVILGILKTTGVDLKGNIVSTIGGVTSSVSNRNFINTGSH